MHYEPVYKQGSSIATHFWGDQTLCKCMANVEGFARKIVHCLEQLILSDLSRSEMRRFSWRNCEILWLLQAGLLPDNISMVIPPVIGVK